MAKRIGDWKLYGYSPTPEKDKEIEPLFTTPPAAPVPLTDDQVDAATKAWFENDIVAGQNPFRKRMRAAFAAAHGITEKGGAA